MIQQGSSPILINEQSESLEPLSAIELNVLNQMLNGYTVSEIAANVGYSDLLVASALRSIEKKTDSNNLVRATIKLVQSGLLKI